jgi:putative kinase
MGRAGDAVLDGGSVPDYSHPPSKESTMPLNYDAVTEPTVIELELDGHRSQFAMHAAELETVHLPLLRDLERYWRERRNRFIVFLSGPPGSGKSSLAGLWEQLARQGRIAVPVQPLPMDGFHYPNQVLDSQHIRIDGVEMPLRRIKGRPESFDLQSLRQSLQAMKAGESVSWPRYDRTLHDPLPGAIAVLAEGILVVEGLYLLLDSPGWRELRALADYGIFVECPEEVLRPDLVARKQRQGRSYEDAAAHYELVDHYTWNLTIRQRHGVDTIIRSGSGRRLDLPTSPPPCGDVHPDIRRQVSPGL